MITLLHPWYLLLLPAAIAALLWSQRDSMTSLTQKQRRVCFFIRCLLISLLVLAIAGVRLLRPSDRVSTIFAVDASASIRAAATADARLFVERALASKKTGDVGGIAGFAGTASIWSPPGTSASVPQTWPTIEEKGETDIGNVLDFAGAMLPPDGTRRIVLLSDGNETRGTAAGAAERLSTRGIEVWTVPLRNPFAPEVLVETVAVPARLRAGESFDLTAVIRSNIETPAKVRLYQNQFLLQEREILLKTGKNDFRVPSLQAEGKFLTYELEVIPEKDTSAENNKGIATASLRGNAKVLVIDTDERQMQPLATALRAKKIDAEVRGSAGLPATMEDLQQYDLFILSDVPALKIPRERMELYRRWVQDFSGSFLMLGGENAYGVGGYYRTPIEQMLPVRMEHDDRQDTPSVALLIVLDRSGSMTAQVQGQTKISLADRGAVFALSALQPKDYFGVLAVDTQSHTIVPLGPVASVRAGAEQRIMTINAGGGGIYIYTSLAEAAQILRDIPARIKHVILFSDASDAEEKVAGEMADGARSGGSALDLASSMLAAKITTSVVGLGSEQDKDAPFLRQLAERGNGRFYLTSDATNLPQIFSTETMKVSQSSLVEEPFIATSVSTSTMISGIDWPQSPLLLGYNATKIKPGAELLLATETGEPLLATWRYGLGQTAAFTSDAKARWGAEWLAWPGYGKFWAQVVRGLMRKTETATYHVETQETGDTLHLKIQAMTLAGTFKNQAALEVRASRQDSEPLLISTKQTAPGEYEGNLPLPPLGTTTFSITQTGSTEHPYVFTHTRSYPREYLLTEPDTTALRSLADLSNGKLEPLPEEIFRASPVARPVQNDLSNLFLIAALLLLPLDIWLRRRQWSLP